MPMITEGKVSGVARPELGPIIRASAVSGYMPKKIDRTIDIPTIPPSNSGQ